MAKPSLTVKERQELAFRVLQLFEQKPLKRFEEYSAKNRTLIARANKLATQRADVARAVLAQTGKQVRSDVTKRTQQRQIAKAVETLKPTKIKKPEPIAGGGGQFLKRDYTTKTDIRAGVKYKIITSTYPPFPPGTDIPQSDILAYYHGEQLALIEYGGYVVDPIKWIRKVLRAESKGFDIGNTTMQGIVRTAGGRVEYKAKFGSAKTIKNDTLAIIYLNVSYSEVSDIADRAEGLKQKFGLVKQVQLKLREFITKKRGSKNGPKR